MSENINTPANVQALKTKLDAMSQTHRKTGKSNLWDMAVSINRTNAVPLDKSSVIFEDGEADDKDTIKAAADKATAYPGQIISGLKASDGKVYVLQPDDHEHNTHITNAGESKTYSDQTKSEESVYEELATQSNVDYQVNKEAYQRQVVNNARTNTEKQIAKFILEKDKSESIDDNGDIVDLVNIDKNGDIILTVPDKLSDGTTTPAGTTVLDYVKATVEAEKTVRTASDTVLAKYIGTANPSFTDKDGLISTSLTLPQKLSNTAGRTATTVLGFIEETVQAEKDDRVQATFDLADYIGTGVAIAHTDSDPGDPILTGMSLPDKLSDKTSTPSDVTNLLRYIEATVEAEVQKRYAQDLVLLDIINELNLSRVVTVGVSENTPEDCCLNLWLQTGLRNNLQDVRNQPSEKDSHNTPLRKYNN